MRYVASWMLVFVAWASCTFFSMPAWAGMVSTPKAGSSDEARAALEKAVRARAGEVGVADRIPEKVLATASVAQLSILLDSMGANARAGQYEFVVAVVVVVVVIVLLIIILTPSGGGAGTDNTPPPPPRDPVPPIRNCSIKIRINISYAWQHDPKEEVGPNDDIRGELIAELNDLGRADGNSFAEAVGVASNLTFDITIYDDGTRHFSASMTMSGWGWGTICTVGTGDYKYPDRTSDAMVEKMVDQAYEWIHNGWHENR